MPKLSETQELFLANVYTTARSTGEASSAVVDLLKTGKINWKNRERVAVIATEFRLGRIAGYLKLTDRDAAIDVDKRKSWKHGDNSENRRTEIEQKAYRSAVSAWSYTAQLAGMPNAFTGGQRATRKSTQPAPSTQPSMPELAPVDAVLSLPKATSPQDVSAFALRVCDMIVAYERRNARSVKFGGLKDAFDDFVAKVRAISHIERTAA